MPSYCYILILIHVLFAAYFKTEIYGTKRVRKYPLTPTWFNIMAIAGGLVSVGVYMAFAIGEGIFDTIWMERVKPMLSQMPRKPRR